VKVLHRQDFDPKQLAVFKREVEVLSQIYHPNVCLFMGACFEKGDMMIVSELIPKGDLEKMLRNKSLDMPLFLRVQMAIEAARGMCWLHFGDPAFIHRDVSLLLFENDWGFNFSFAIFR
jgi:serine/threonine protein kinase